MEWDKLVAVESVEEVVCKDTAREIASSLAAMAPARRSGS